MGRTLSPRLAVLVSGGGRSLQNLLERERAGKLGATVALVLGSKPDLPAYAHATHFGVPHATAKASEIAGHLAPAGVDFVIMAGYLKRWVIPSEWVGRTINIHPSLLPWFGGPGLYGHYVHEAVLASGMRISGCTTHFVTGEYDAGPIIAQRAVRVEPNDTPDSLAARVFVAERELLPATVRALAAGQIRMVDGKTRYEGAAP